MNADELNMPQVIKGKHAQVKRRILPSMHHHFMLPTPTNANAGIPERRICWVLKGCLFTGQKCISRKLTAVGMTGKSSLEMQFAEKIQGATRMLFCISLVPACG